MRRNHPVVALWEGVIQNIGRGGALISIELNGNPAAPDPGDEVSVEMLLVKSNAFEQRCMHCRGPVVRIEEHSSETMCIGVRFDVTTVCTAAETWLWHLNDTKLVS